MADDSLLKEILDSLEDQDTVQLFATANGLVGDAEVEDRLRELQWEKHINNLWQEVLSDMEPPTKKNRRPSQDDVQPSTSGQVGGGGSSEDPLEKPYFIWKRDTRTFKKNLARDTTFKVKFNEQWRGNKLLDIPTKLHDMFEDLLSEARGHDADLGRVVLSHSSLNNPIIVPLQSWENLNADVVMSEITKVLNSNESLPVDENLLVTIGSIDLPKGGVNPSKLPITSLFGPKNSLERKRSLFHVQNDNNLCLAISIGLCYLKTCKKVDVATWKKIVRDDPGTMLDHVIKHHTVTQSYYDNILKTSRKKMQTQLAIWLCERAGVPTDRYLGLNDIEPFETLLDVCINVVSSRVGNKFVRVTEDQEKPRLYLYHVDTETEKHWHGIAKIQGFFKASYFCHTCLKPYKDKSKHSCATSCEICLYDHCPETDVQMGCRTCGRVCRSKVCFERHRKQRVVKKESYPPSCELFHQCKKCRVTLQCSKRSPKLHICHEWQCPNCLEYQIGEHRCYQKPVPSSKDKNKKFIFYDFETRQDDIFQCELGYRPSHIRCEQCVKKERQCVDCRLCQNCRDPSCGLQQHRVNFAVLQTTCHRCEKKELVEDATCSCCGSRCIRCSPTHKGEYVNPPCPDTCGKREVVFSGDDAAERFCDFVTSNHCKDSILIAHNAKSFDLYPVLEVLIDRHSIRPSKIIYNGSKIMYMHIAQKLNLTFVDSLNFLPMKLAKIPDAFNLQELCKGYFPHLFNTKANQNYVGPYPELKYYGYDFMSTGERKKLAEWHAAKGDETFNFRQEMLQYCRSDVDILRRGCLEFRNLMIDVTTITKTTVQANGIIKKTSSTGVDPFDYVTIASVCMGIFKSLFLKGKSKIEITKDGESDLYDICIQNNSDGVRFDDDTWTSLVDLKRDKDVQIGKQHFTSPIAVVPSQGYTKRDNYSKISIQWLEWLMEKSRQRGNPLVISHALNGGEFQVPGTNYRCDGFAKTPAGDETIYEFYGCVFHGCPSCFPDDRNTIKHPSTNQTIKELYDMTKNREKELKELGYKLVIIWEHQFKFQLEKNAALQQFVATLDLQDRLDPRDSFFGGRTNAIKLHYQATEDETIQYYDFTSLYPWTNKYCRYPVGHPTIITDDFQDLSQYFGLAKIKILPPRQLYHPVLPYNSNGKLKFPLCKTCADSENQNECTCSLEERSITGTWCTPEIQMARSKGYKILQIYEVYHFDESSKYDVESCEGGLFAQYVNMFLKIKQEASGFPSECNTEEAKRNYIREYKEKEGIQLEYDKIKKNPGLRCLAKLCLNSFWGKFGQRLGMQQSVFIHESEAENFFKMLSDPTKVPHNFHIVSTNILQLEWSNNSLFTSFDNKTNIFLASFTTMWARLKLYGVLDKLKENVLYFDTDSVIFKTKKSDDLNYLPIGNYLGELTNEISQEDGYIVEFVSGGPKNYAYRTLSGKEECKVRGFTLNWANSKLINFHAIKSMICTSHDRQIEIVNPCKISRDSRKRKLLNRVETKNYKMVYTKRRILPNLDTLPFGF